MRSDRFTQILLAVITLALVTLALRPHLTPSAVHAQVNSANVYIEPGTFMISTPDKSQQFYGKVVVDLDNGKVWAFPTLTPAPYPVDTLNPAPPTSRPVYLGRFDLTAMKK